MATRKNSYLYLGGNDQRMNSICSGPQFEFDESEVWNSSNDVIPTETKRSTSNSRVLKKPLKKGNSIDRRPIAATSLPVSIPDWPKILGNEYASRQRCQNDDNVDDRDDDEEEDGRIPPHEYLARTRVASFSVHEGIGRTLKGRDLSRVRNAIWKQTGFED